MTDYTIISNNFKDYYHNVKGFRKAYYIADRILVNAWLRGEISSQFCNTNTKSVTVVDKKGDKDLEVTFAIKNELTKEEFNVTVIFNAKIDFNYDIWEEEERHHYAVDTIWFKDISNIRLSTDHMLSDDEKITIADMFTTYITDKRGFKE